MARQARDFAAFQSVSAYVVLAPETRERVAIVQAHFSESKCTVTAYDREAGKPQTASASGYGYDKFTAALSHLTIDGHALNDHCGRQLDPPSKGYRWPRDYTPPTGYQLANYDREGGGYRSCFRLPGFDFLTAHGYEVIQAC